MSINRVVFLRAVLWRMPVLADYWCCGSLRKVQLFLLTLSKVFEAEMLSRACIVLPITLLHAQVPDRCFVLEC